MVAACESYFQGFVVRVTRLDECGAPVAGACSTVVSDGFVKVETEPDEEDGEVLTQVKADGTRCYYRKGPKQLNGFKTNIEFCDVDPELFNIATGVTLVTDDATPPVSRGFAVDSATYAQADFALEVWTDTANSSCPTTTQRWGYILLPWLAEGTVGTPTIENGAANFTVKDAMTMDGNGWGVGPYDIQTSALGVASPLFSPISTTTHFLLYQVNLAPPVDACGCQTLVIPT